MRFAHYFSLALTTIICLVLLAVSVVLAVKLMMFIISL